MVNRMSLKVNMNVKDRKWRPGLPLINDPKYNLYSLPMNEKIQILDKFCEYLANSMKNLLVKRIKTQYRYLRWAPLSTGYVEFKKKLGLSPNIWEATGLLVNSITYYIEGDNYVVGVDPKIKYPNSNVRVLFVAECMEFGTKYMPARPLFGPTINFMRRNVRKYWEAFYQDQLGGYHDLSI